MKKILVTLSLISFIGNFWAQTTTSFRKDYNVSLFDIPMTSIEGLTPNTYVFSGFHAFSSSITAVDNTGVTTWSRRFASGLSLYIGDVKKDTDLNRYYACGGDNSGPAVLMFLDANGNYISGRNFSISQASGASFNRVIKTSDGGYLCVGTVTRYDPDGAGPEVQFNSVTNNDGSCDQSHTESIQSPLIVKFDASGNHVWHQVFRYYITSAIPANRIYNDASFVDVVEISDGYLAIGSYDVNNVFSTFNSDCEDTTPTDAMILKTNKSDGSIIYHRQIDNPSSNATQSSKSFSSASVTSTGLPLISAADGDGGRPMALMRFAGSGGWAAPTWIRRYGASSINLFFTTTYNPFQPGRFFETSDGNYAIWGFHINSFAFDWSNVLMKMNTSGDIQWSRQYSNELAVILPHGEQTTDEGYVGVSYTLAGTGHNLHLIKTDPNGNTSSDCPSVDVSVSRNTPSYTWGTPIYNAWNANTVTNGAFTPTVTNITPTETTQCLTVITECIPPQAPTTVTATPATICPGESSIITASGPSDPNVNYNVYDAATGGTNLGATPLTVSPTSTTSYWVEAVDNTDPNCVSTTRTEVVVTVTDGPTVSNAGEDQTVCGNSATLAGNTATSGTGTWTVVSGSGTFANANNPTTTVSSLGNGTNVFRWTISNPPCPDSFDEVTITSVTAPTVANAGNDQTLCATSTTLEGNTATVGSGTWTVVSGSGTFADANNPTTTVSGLGTGANVFEWTITNDPCPASSDQVTITNTGGPTTANAGNDQTICGTSTTLEGNTAAVGTGTWTVISGSGTFADASNPTTTVSGLSAGANVFQWTIANDPCVPSSDQVTITIVEAPSTANAGDNQTLCATSATLEGNTPTVGTGTWTVISGTGTFADANNPTTTVSGLGLGNNIFEWTITNDPCPASSDQVTITNTGGPTTANAGNDQTICGTSTTLEGNTAAVGTGTWTVISGSGTFADASNPTTTVSGLSAGANVFQWTISNDPCVPSTDQVTITAVETPTTASAGSNQTLCATSTTLEGNTPTVGTGTWSVVSGTGTFADASNPITTVSGLGLGDNIFEWTITNDPCPASSDQVTVTNTGGPTISIVSTSDVSCNGGNNGEATVSASGGVAPYNYSWSPSGGSNATATGLSPGDYTATVTDNLGCSDDILVTIGEPSAITLDLSSTASSCATPDGTATVIASGGNGSYTYSWSPSGGNADVANGLAPGEYTVTVQDATLCEVSESVTVGVSDGPVITIESTTLPLCNGGSDGSAEISVTGGTGNYTYSWDPSVGSGPIVTGLSYGIYTVTVEDEAGCQAIENITIGEFDALSVSENIVNATCTGDDGSISLTVSGGVSGYSYAWQPNNETTSSITGNAGNYTVTITDANNCEITADYTIGLTNNLVATVDPSITTIEGGESVDLLVTIDPELDNVTYTWTPTEGLSCSDCPNPTASPSETTTYEVAVLSDNGCYDTAQAIIIVTTPCGDIFMPTIFSPNGDGLNDELCLLGNCIVELDLKIYDRWGELVFETTDQNNCWDGTFRGRIMNSAVFVYKLFVRTTDGQEVEESGNVNLVR